MNSSPFASTGTRCGKSPIYGGNSDGEKVMQTALLLRLHWAAFMVRVIAPSSVLAIACRAL
jgi:hypothetical protein